MTDLDPAERLNATSTTTIQDLNDHVLGETFKYLRLSDLCSAADVCYNFKRNAQAEFSMRYSQYKVVNLSIGWRKSEIKYWRMEESALINISQSSSIFRNFGASMEFLKIKLEPSKQQFSSKVIEPVIQYCGETLKGLDCKHIKFTADLVLKLRPLLSQLQEIDVRYPYWESQQTANDMFSSCSKLQKLQFGGHPYKNALNLDFPIRRNIATLESVIIYNCPLIRKQTFIKFLKVNPQLKRIEVRTLDLFPPEVVHSIAQYCPQIEKIVFIGWSKSPAKRFKPEHLKHSIALKTLDFNCRRASIPSVISEFIAACSSLECLQLSSVKSNRKLVEMISQMENLRKLSLLDPKCMRWDDILEIVSNLKELTHLALRVVIPPPTALVDIVRRSPKLLELEIDQTHLFGEHVLYPACEFDEDIFTQILEIIATRNMPNRLILLLPEYLIAKVSDKMQTTNKNRLELKASQGRRSYGWQ